MKAHQLSASKIDLAMWCTYWARSDVTHPARPMGAPALRGTAVHKASDCYFHGSPLPRMDEDAMALWGSLKEWLRSMPPFTHSELALLYDAERDSAHICETGEDERDYLGVTGVKLPMRLDLIRYEGGIVRQVHIVDIKTGSRSNTSPAHENMQLATQAIAASRYYGVESVKVGLVFPMKTKVHPPEWHTLDADALDEHAGKLHRVLKTIPDSVPVKGQHCWRCPIGPAKGFRTDCPAWADEEAA